MSPQTPRQRTAPLTDLVPLLDRVEGPSAQRHLSVLRAALALTRGPRHRGFGTAVAALGRRFPPTNRAVFAIGDAVLPVRMADRYWMRLLQPGFCYEPDVARILHRALTPKSAFVDGGANIGYWSAFAQNLLDPRRCVAVEASATTFDDLTVTAEANGGRFDVRHAALWDRPGTLELSLDADRHERAHLVTTAVTDRGRIEQVPAVTLADLFDVLPDDADRIVVKLDVEGAEVPVLRSSASLIGDGVLVVYEDHGKDRTHEVTRVVRDELGLEVGWVDPSTGRLHRLQRLDELDAHKELRWRGYDLVAGDLGLLSRPSRTPPSPRGSGRGSAGC